MTAPEHVNRIGLTAEAVFRKPWRLSQDGSRFLMIRHGKPEGPYEVRVILNWLQEANPMRESGRTNR